MTSRLLIATQNKGKIAEFTRLLSPAFSCVSFLDEPFCKQEIPDVAETGTTYHANAELKAKAYFQIFNTPLLTDDSGLEVDLLGGEPGIYSARFGGTDISWPERWDFLYAKLKGHPPERWTARFRSVICHCDSQGKVSFYEATIEGKISPTPLGGQGFGYDPIFFCNEIGKTFGEASAAEKGRVSHRARAVKKFLQSSNLDHSAGAE